MTTAKEHVRAQQHAQGARQRHQEAEAHQVRVHAGHGPQVPAESKVLQEVQRIEEDPGGLGYVSSIRGS